MLIAGTVVGRQSCPPDVQASHPARRIAARQRELLAGFRGPRRTGMAPDEAGGRRRGQGEGTSTIDTQERIMCCIDATFTVADIGADRQARVNLQGS